MQISEVNAQTIYSAAQVHAASWRESHQGFCSAEFVAQHTTQRQLAHLQRELDAGKRLYLLTDGKPMGLVSVDGNVIENLYVLPGEQGKGYGGVLLEFAIGKCHGIPTLWILSNNVRAHAFYQKRGFVETGKRNPLREDLWELEMRLLRSRTRPAQENGACREKP